jgi:hypothetical protein
MQKALDQMNVQVHRAVADLTGVTGMAIVRAIVDGERDPARLAMHRDGHCRKSAPEIARYLTGTWRAEHLFNLASALRVFDALETEIGAYDAQLLKELESMQPPERQQEPLPPTRIWPRRKPSRRAASSRPEPPSGVLPAST